VHRQECDFAAACVDGIYKPGLACNANGVKKCAIRVEVSSWVPQRDAIDTVCRARCRHSTRTGSGGGGFSSGVSQIYQCVKSHLQSWMS